jgi:hypothetical protein
MAIPQLVKTGGIHNNWEGDNRFFAPANIMNISATGDLRMASVNDDGFYEDVAFTGGDSTYLFAGYTGNSYFYKDITVETETVVMQNATFTGTHDQELNGSVKHQYDVLEVNKTSGDCDRINTC